MLKFEVGSVVRLKSDSPNMTVSETVENGSKKIVHCTWFVNCVPVYGEFEEEQLELSEDY